MHIEKDEKGNYIIPPLAGKTVYFFTGADKEHPIRDGKCLGVEYREEVENDIVKHYFFTRVENYPNAKNARNLELKHVELTEEDLKATLKAGVEALVSEPI